MWEKEKILANTISPFPTMFSKDFLLQDVKSCHCLVKG